MNLKYKWKHGRNKYQEYYEANVGGDYLLVFKNEHVYSDDIWDGKTWLGSYNAQMIWKKKRKRKKPKIMQTMTLLSSTDPQYMMRKVEYCYDHKQTEITP